jgi:hypothetical protein
MKIGRTSSDVRETELYVIGKITVRNPVVSRDRGYSCVPIRLNVGSNVLLTRAEGSASAPIASSTTVGKLVMGFDGDVLVLSGDGGNSPCPIEGFSQRDLTLEGAVSDE